MENTTLSKKTVFVSYCHRDTTEEWIDKFATALGQYGIDTIVDIYDLQLGQDLNYFMEQIKKVDKVLILLGEVYKEKANEREGGVGTETQIISNDVYNDVEQTKFIPIVINKDENGNAFLPYYLETRLYIDFSDDELFGKNIEELARQIHKLPKRAKPPVAEPPKSLIQRNFLATHFILSDKIDFDEMEKLVLKELENAKCSYEEYKEHEDEVILKKIDETKEIRDAFVQQFLKKVKANTVVLEDLVSFFEKMYSVTDNYGNGMYYDAQNDAAHFLRQEIIIYIVAVLYKEKKFEEIAKLIRTTYFPDTLNYTRDGIPLDYFYHYLPSLRYRNDRLQLRRKSIHADLLMQRANIDGVNIEFSDIRFADCLILLLSEWFYASNEKTYFDWYPVTVVYGKYGREDFLQLKKFLVSKSRFDVIRNLFAVNSKDEFKKRYIELRPVLLKTNRRSEFVTIPSICSIVSPEELFSKE